MNKHGSILAGVLITFAVIFFIGLMIVGSFVGTYNGLVKLDTNTEQKWANVQTAYERRADLIPNLVNTVKGYSKYEGDVQKQVASLRSGIKSASNPSEMSKVGSEMNSLISNLIVSVEAYPDLKANVNYLALQDELAGTENRIKWERDNYNEAVKDYKQKVRSFPTNVVAGMFGFEQSKWDMFEASQGNEEAPEVSFD